MPCSPSPSEDRSFLLSEASSFVRLESPAPSPFSSPPAFNLCFPCSLFDVREDPPPPPPSPMPSLLSWRRAAGPRRRMSFWPASLRSPAAPPPSPLVLQRGEKAGVSASDSSEQQPDEAKAGWQAFERNSAESREHMHAPIDRQGQRKRQACGAAPRSAVNKTVPQCGSSVNDAGGCRAPACGMPDATQFNARTAGMVACVALYGEETVRMQAKRCSVQQAGGGGR